MYLTDIKIVDLTVSVIDKEKSDPANGIYEFTKKSYIDYAGDKQARPQFQFSWNLDKPFAIADWKRKWPGADFVKVGDAYWPEGCPPAADGRYTFGDAVLMKIPLRAYLVQRQREIQNARMAPDLALKQLASEYRAAGVEVGDDELKDLISRRA